VKRREFGGKGAFGNEAKAREKGDQLLAGLAGAVPGAPERGRGELAGGDEMRGKANSGIAGRWGGGCRHRPPCKYPW
jgi:hypothetical protein